VSLDSACLKGEKGTNKALGFALQEEGNMEIEDADARYLLRSIRAGETAVILGAGASFGGKNARDEPIKMGDDLGSLLSERAGLTYGGEPLSEVYEAVQGRLSDARIHRVLQEEYTGTMPPNGLIDLLSFAWKRLYTFNIDDTLDNIRPKNGQRLRFYNGMIDKVAEYPGPAFLQAIYLHGQASKPEHGLIFSETQYAGAYRTSPLDWYVRAGQDYIECCPLFIGTRLNERVLWSQVERAKRDTGSGAGLGFVITPDKITPITRDSLRRRGIVHLQATLDQFVRWLKENFPSGYSPRDINEYNTKVRGIIDDITPDDINAVSNLILVDRNAYQQELAQFTINEIERRGRMFFRGFPPSWPVALSTIPVWLSRSEDLLGTLRTTIAEGRRLFIVTGQAGSGKTTALMMALLRNMEDNNRKLYEVRGGTSSIARILAVLRKLREPCLVYIPDLLLYGDSLALELEKMSSDQIIIVTSARSSEWTNHFSRHLSRFATTFTFSRFLPADHKPLIDRLLKYVPSPQFARMRPADRLTRLAGSREQLLIALHQVTEFGAFGDTISHEFKGLPNADAQLLCIIVGLATMARVGIAEGIAREAYSTHCRSETFEHSLAALDGIVERTDTGRLIARHELYIRHIVWNDIDFEIFARGVTSILGAFRRYEVPIIAKMNKKDGVLFKFMLNHAFINEVSRQHKSVSRGLEIYENFEIHFQLDGHFWLQYGLYMIRLNRHADALRLLKNSIEAYPQNPFALHALAHLQFRLVFLQPTMQGSSEQLVAEAITTLESLAARQNSMVDGSVALDTYPLVTLALDHVAVLAKHGRMREAKGFATDYHERLQAMERHLPEAAIRRAREALIRFTTLNEPPRPFFNGDERGRSRHERDRNGRGKGMARPAGASAAAGPSVRRDSRRPSKEGV
jgi:hypothetical protein